MMCTGLHEAVFVLGKEDVKEAAERIYSQFAPCHVMWEDNQIHDEYLGKLRRTLRRMGFPYTVTGARRAMSAEALAFWCGQ